MSKLKILVKLTLIYFAVLNPSTAMTFDRDYLYNFIEIMLKAMSAYQLKGK